MEYKNFKIEDGKIMVTDYPNADKVFELPESILKNKLEDYILHKYDIEFSLKCLDTLMTLNFDDLNDTNQIIIKSLFHSLIINYYKCFIYNEHRKENTLGGEYNTKENLLKIFPEEALNVFFYYKNLRSRVIAHDNSRYSEVYTGIVIDSSKEKPFVDILSTAFISSIIPQKEYLDSLRNLIIISLNYVVKEIDSTYSQLVEEYKDTDNYERLKEIAYAPPTTNEFMNRKKRQ